MDVDLGIICIRIAGLKKLDVYFIERRPFEAATGTGKFTEVRGFFHEREPFGIEKRVVDIFSYQFCPYYISIKLEIVRHDVFGLANDF